MITAKPIKRGRPKNEQKMYLVKMYLEMGLNQTEIAKKLKTSSRQVNRWRHYLKKLSTDRHLTIIGQ